MQQLEVFGCRFDLPGHYKLIKPIGQGACGIVCAVEDTTTGAHMALKQIPRVFNNLTETKRTLREIRLLRCLRHRNIVSLIHVLPPVSPADFNEIYLASELLDTDLNQIINSAQPLTDEHIQYFMWQLLCGLQFIHLSNVLHRDLKPSNILLNKNCELKIADFGLARVAEPEKNHKEFLTEYVATRWYRAPEIMLSWNEYTSAIDVWSAGCIFGELLGRKPVFPGKDYIHQITLITDITGSPTPEDSAYIENEKALHYIQSLPFKPKVPLARLYPQATPMAIDLMEKIVQFNPAQRITVTEALAHPYLLSYASDEEMMLEGVEVDFEFEEAAPDAAVLRQLLLSEIEFFRRENAS